MIIKNAAFNIDLYKQQFIYINSASKKGVLYGRTALAGLVSDQSWKKISHYNQSVFF